MSDSTNFQNNQIEALKVTIIADIQRDRRAWWLTEIPQIIILFFLVVGLIIVTGYGLYTSISTLAEGKGTEQIEQTLKVFVTGSSSLLGFIVFKLLTKLGEMTKLFLQEQKRFTSDINVIRMSFGEADVKKVLSEYYKRG